MIKDRTSFFKRNPKGSHKTNSDLSKGVWKSIEDYEAEIIFKKALSNQEKSWIKNSCQIGSYQMTIQDQIDAVDSFSLIKEAVYHNGSLIGLDVKKTCVLQ